MTESTMKSTKVLILGAGHVAEPMVEYLARVQETKLVIVSAIEKEVDYLCKKYPSCEPLLLNVLQNPVILDNAIKEMNLVISLLPPTMHSKIIKHCIDNKTNVVTASYCTPDIKELHEAAVDAGITVMNEVGLDPGIDHLLAMSCFHEVEQKGGKVISFISHCGGLPAPECSHNPLRYKFTWNPKGALENTLAGAKYLKDDEFINIAPGGALLDCTEPLSFLPGIVLEGSPNRDSTIYKKLYGINDATSILRGTLRYEGFFDMVKGLKLTGLLDTATHPNLDSNSPDITWRQFVSTLISQSDHSMDYDKFKAAVTEKVGSQARMEGLESLGLLSNNLIVKFDNPMDTLSNYLSKTLALKKGERDLIVLRHEIQIQWPNNEREIRAINLVCYGETNGYSAMAKTVGYTTAIAAQMLLDKEIQTKGMVLPFKPEIFEPMLSRLAKEDIKAVETSTWLH